LISAGDDQIRMTSARGAISMTDVSELPPDPLHAFFAPRGILVMGVSRDPTRLGYSLTRNVVARSPAPVYLMHPEGGEWNGSRLHRTIEELPRPVDLALILLPAAGVAQALRQCAQIGVRAAIVESGGFREVGEQGQRLENELAAVARECGVRLIGPNCIGVLDTHLPLDTTFLAAREDRAGPIAFVSHSGATCSAVLEIAMQEGWGFSRVISLGNQADVSEAEALLSLAHDPHTRAIGLYLEGIQDASRFVDAARAVSRVKPIVALKVGRSVEGQRAARSHTGALASSDKAVQAAFDQCGIIRARDVEQLLTLTRSLANLPPPQGPRTAILTNAGGAGVMAADLVHEHGLTLAQFSLVTHDRLVSMLSAPASPENPVDMLAMAGGDEYAECARLLLSDDGVDALVVTIVPPPTRDAVAIAGSLVPVLRGATKPAVVAIMGGEMAASARAKLRAVDVVECGFPAEAVLALGAAWQRARMLSAARTPLKVLRGKLASPWEGLRAKRSTLGADSILGARAAKAIGLRVPKWIVAAGSEAAVQAAGRIGFPVALKAVGARLVHKTEAGGVALALESARDVRRAYRDMHRAVEDRLGKGALEAVLVQAMAPAGQEVVLGAVRDPQFGPLLMFGSGGKEVEGMGDLAFALAPLTLDAAEKMLDATWAGRRLVGLRGGPRMDRTAILAAMAAIEGLMLDNPGLLEFEVNPLIVTPSGVWAVDVRLTHA
jgi:acetate---CoA ligase (ADP-forming)